MGLIKELTLLPVAPLRFTLWTAEQIADEADRQQHSPGAIVRQLEEIEERRDRGELDPEEAERLQGEIIEEQAAARPSGDRAEEGTDG
jgi:hypothetical protein